jgi:hypothetical protein
MLWKWFFKACTLFQEFHCMFNHHPMIIFNILCYWLKVSPWPIHGNKWTLFFCFFIYPSPGSPLIFVVHFVFIGCPISWFLIILVKGWIYGRLEELAMVILFVQKLCPKLNGTMCFQSCIELLVVIRQ